MLDLEQGQMPERMDKVEVISLFAKKKDQFVFDDERRRNLKGEDIK